MNIQPIVEGHGEVAAAPTLLRRLRDEAGAWEIDIGSPIRCPRNRLIRQDTLETFVKVALRQPRCAAILIMFDGDDDCPAELGPRVRRWAAEASEGKPCEVVIPHREFEAWFLAALESLQGSRGIRCGARYLPNPEAQRDAKGQLTATMHPGKSYKPNLDQPAFSARFSMAAAHARCRSFRKLTKSFGDLLSAMGQNVDSWPPVSWMESD